MTILLIAGTRPEVIKLAPVVLELRSRGIGHTFCLTGQQRQMSRQMLDVFGLDAQVDLDVMSERQSLSTLSQRLLAALSPLVRKVLPRAVVVQGDTTSALVGALSAFYEQVPVAHVEAGLRTTDFYDPFPEEVNRRLISVLSRVHLAPTAAARDNLLREGVDASTIHVTGNTVVDALQHVVARSRLPAGTSLERAVGSGRVVLVTMHRRENLGEPMRRVFRAVAALARSLPDVQVVFPVHLNPAVRSLVAEELAGAERVHLVDPLGYEQLAWVLARCSFVMTDSGGLQEEAPALGKPVLVLRENTERPEGISAGTARLVGTATEVVLAAAFELLNDADAYRRMATAVSPYGDGNAAPRVVDQLERFLA